MDISRENTRNVISPGNILDDLLIPRDLSKRSFAAQCGHSTHFVREIIAGRASLTEESAIRFSRVLGTDPQMWVLLEYQYREKLADKERTKKLVTSDRWIRKFPIREMQQFELLSNDIDAIGLVDEILEFFGSASRETFEASLKQQLGALDFRKSKSIARNPIAVLIWLNWGVRQSKMIEVGRYSSTKFRATLAEIRKRTSMDPTLILETCKVLCAEAGVRLVITPEFKDTCLSAATRWDGNIPLIQLSQRHKTDDHLWSTFFHQAAHILLHRRKKAFLDEGKGNLIDDYEREADEFARDCLIPPDEWRDFVSARSFASSDVLSFSDQCGIAPGIVVGRLQQEKRVLQNTALNILKRRGYWDFDTECLS